MTETPERKYKYGSLYIYCNPEDKKMIQFFAKEMKVPMKVLLHRLVFAAEIAIPNKTKVIVLNGAAFWEMFEIPGVDNK
jgi:hypothetical protein